MKMHSYAFYNGHLSETERRLHALDDPSTASKAPAYQYPSAGHTPSAADREQKDSDEKTQLAKLREDLAIELTSPMGSVTYPKNLTWANYTDYIFCPTLCYELEYPRTESIVWTELGYKVLAVFGVIFLLTITSEEFILPVMTESALRIETAVSFSEIALILAESISMLLFPFMITFLLVFLVIFEYVLGAFAEITCFADRHFYSDWWNSTDWLEFSREWNIPVHHFFRRHVYSASRPHIGRPMATLITFLISAIGHEIVMTCITKKIRGYGFLAQMSQLPIVMLQRTKWIKGRKTLNNVCFWCSMILGLAMVRSLSKPPDCANAVADVFPLCPVLNSMDIIPFARSVRMARRLAHLFRLSSDTPLIDSLVSKITLKTRGEKDFKLNTNSLSHKLRGNVEVM
jgi:sterol O-acyltransferase